MVKTAEDPRRYGSCELCGGHNRDLRILAVDGFIGWACEECRRQLAESLPRRYSKTGEETEPGE